VAVCLFTTGVSQVEQDLKKIADEAGKKYGEDYVYLGYKPYPAIVITALGQDFAIPSRTTTTARPSISSP
jgi:hypothetical protein